MVNIDTVYQRVLALANKEQRGYITPQDFNLFANQAQMEIFEQYFYDLNQFGRAPGNDTMHADMIDILEEKISNFEVTADLGLTQNAGNLDTLPRFYRLSNVRRNEIILESVSRKDYRIFPNSPLTAPTATRPIYMVDTINNVIQVAGRRFGRITIDYIQSPAEVNWDYIVVNDKALYNATSSTDFELHLSEASELVYRILAFAGIAIEKPQLTQVAANLEQSKVQQEKQ